MNYAKIFGDYIEELPSELDSLEIPLLLPNALLDKDGRTIVCLPNLSLIIP